MVKNLLVDNIDGHVIYLCDEAGLSFWEKTLAPLSRDGDISVFKVRAKGNIFQTNEQLLPFETNDFEIFLPLSWYIIMGADAVFVFRLKYNAD